MPKGIKWTEEQREKFKKSQKGHSVSKEARKKISDALKNNKHFNWKEKPTYGIVHYWLRVNYVKPICCQFCNKEKIIDWALIKGKTYERKRDNFIPLCRKCHVRYDRNDIRVRPKCIDCNIELKDWYAKRCQSHAQQERFKKA